MGLNEGYSVKISALSGNYAVPSNFPYPSVGLKSNFQRVFYAFMPEMTKRTSNENALNSSWISGKRVFSDSERDKSGIFMTTEQWKIYVNRLKDRRYGITERAYGESTTRHLEHATQRRNSMHIRGAKSIEGYGIYGS